MNCYAGQNHQREPGVGTLMNAGRTVAIVQPNAFPWLGYFDQLRTVDLVVLYDDVEFSRKSRAQRAQVRGPDDRPEWLTIPVAHGLGRSTIAETHIAWTGCENLWREKIPAKLRQWYRAAPYAGLIEPLATLLAEPHETLADVNIAVIAWIADLLGIHTPMQRSSLMEIPHNLDTTARPLAICQALGARTFLCGPTAKRYIDEPVFTHAGVKIVWHDFSERHPTYATHRQPFIPFLSALDYLIEHGPGWFDQTPTLGESHV